MPFKFPLDVNITGHLLNYCTGPTTTTEFLSCLPHGSQHGLVPVGSALDWDPGDRGFNSSSASTLLCNAGQITSLAGVSVSSSPFVCLVSLAGKLIGGKDSLSLRVRTAPSTMSARPQLGLQTSTVIGITASVGRYHRTLLGHTWLRHMPYNFSQLLGKCYGGGSCNSAPLFLRDRPRHSDCSIKKRCQKDGNESG